MTYRRRAPLAATVGPRAAALILRESAAALDQKARALASHQDESLREVAHEVWAALDSMSDAAALWRERRSGSVFGTAEPRRAPLGGSSESSSLCGPELTTQEVVDQLNGSVSAEYVRRMCRDGRLVGRQPEGSRAWLIQAASVEEYSRQRRSTR